MLHDTVINLGLGAASNTLCLDRLENFLNQYRATTDDDVYWVVTCPTRCQNADWFLDKPYLSNAIDSLLYQKLTQTIDCDSEKLLIQYLTSGTGTRTIHYKSLQTGNSFQAMSNAGGLVEMYLQDSIYVIQYIQDAYCSMVINDTIHHNYRKPFSEILKPEVNCVDGIYQVKIVSQGGVKPYTYYYTYNGINQTLTSATDTMLMNLPNGDYFFENMLDATGCGSYLNTPFLANYTPMQYQGYSLQYDCVSDSTALVLNLFATDSVRLWISKNNLTEFAFWIKAKDLDKNKHFLIKCE
jgi:hypothetical protein